MKPRVNGQIPGPKGAARYERRRKAIASCMPSVFETVVERADGALIEDADGNVLIDFCGGIGVMNIGHTNAEVIQACKDQLDKIVHAQSYTMGYETLIKAAEMLNEITPGNFEKQTAFFNSGAEAVENAIKVARAYTGRDNIVCFTNAFHGRTYLASNLTAKPVPVRWKQGHVPGGIYRLESPYEYRLPKGISKDDWEQYYIDKCEQLFIETLVKTDVACVILEPVQGDGGFIVFPNKFINYIRKLCDDNGIVMIADEIQTGFCRTGKMFGSDWWDVRADIICTSKSMAAGMPLSAITARAEIFANLHKGIIGGTLGGNAVCCAAAIKCMEIFKRDNLADKAVEIGELSLKRLRRLQEKYSVIGDVRGRGAMLAVELVKNRDTKEPDAETTAKILKEAQSNGLVIIGCGARANNIRCLMPLVITEEQLNAGFDILEKAFAKHGY